MHLTPPGYSELRCACTALAFAVWSGPTQALTFEFPAPVNQTFNEAKAHDTYALPIGPYENGAMQTAMIEGRVTQTAWALQAKGLTSLQVLTPLREQLTAAGFAVLFECETVSCGGFDFRFGSEIAAEPAMHVDLGDFRYIAAKRVGPGGPDHVALLVSRSATLGFVQLTLIGRVADVSLPVKSSLPSAEAEVTGPIRSAGPITMAEGLEKQGSVALDDLIFASGAADLAAGEYASLSALALFLRANPDTTVALIGHTDASGALDGNIALSRQRAASVRSRMIEDYSIPKTQIAADGVGYLAPRDSNLTEQGRTRNRRVEVMLLVNP